MGKEMIMAPRETLGTPSIIFHEYERRCKRPRQQKHGVDVVTVLNDTGIANYNRGDYQAAEECFCHAMHYISSNEDHLFFSNITSNIGEEGISKDFIKTHEEEDDDAFNARNCAAHHEQQNDISTSLGKKNDINYDEGMKSYGNLIQIQPERSENEITAILLYNLANTYIQRGFFGNAIKCLYKSRDRFFDVRIADNDNGMSVLYRLMNLQCLGYSFYRSGEESKAMSCYEEAFSIASSERNLGTMIHPEIAASSANCIGILLCNKEQLCKTDLAMEAFLKSLRIYRSIHKTDSVSVATVLNNIGRVHFWRSEFEEARSVYEESFQLRRIALGQNSVDVAATACNLGQTYFQLGLLDESLSSYQEFLRITTYVVGPSASTSKDVAQVFKGLSDIYWDKCEPKMALHYIQKALAVQRECWKKGEIPHSEIAATLNKIGNLCCATKDFQTAMTHYQEGLAIEQNNLPINDPHIIVTMTNIGTIHKQLGEYNHALVAYKKVYKMQRSTFGDESIFLAESMSSIGLMKYYLKDYEGSLESYQEALCLRRQNIGCNDHPEIASTLNSIGLVLFKQGILELAKHCFHESLRIRTKILGNNHRDVGILWYNLATIHFESGEHDLSIQMYLEALRVERHNLGDDHPDVSLTLRHLGQVHHQLGKFEEAIDYFQRALAIEQQRVEDGGKSRTTARILIYLGNSYLHLGRTSDMMECFVTASRIYESLSNGAAAPEIEGYNFYGISKTNPPCAPVA